jgi:hypothetical protein
MVRVLLALAFVGTLLLAGQAVAERLEIAEPQLLQPNPVVAEVVPFQPAQGDKRGWGPEQVLGPPDTPQAGDCQTAWASQTQDGGEEWLRLDYETAVNVAEVRIRESYNPGAVSRVTALPEGGEEVLLWEGEDPTEQAPSDFVVEVPADVTAKSVKVYLDTARVVGWNEIDAVELVGKDGSRQWATFAAASSTYASNTSRWRADWDQGPEQPRPPADPLAPALNKPVVAHVEGGVSIKGTLIRITPELLLISDGENARMVAVNRARMISLEWPAARPAG